LDALGQEGSDIQRRIVTELCQLRGLPDDVPNPDAGLRALRHLKELARDQKIVVEREHRQAEQRAREARQRQASLAARAEKMAELRETLAILASSRDDPQGRGYSLEDLLAELFELHEIPYRRPYRTPTEQIDGHFGYRGFDYLVEARWRAQPPVEADLGAFKTKVDKKIQSTRGLFVSMSGFRQEVVLEFTRGITSNIVLMDGMDLTLILEGRVSLTDALDLKTEKAAQEGILYFPLVTRFVG
ncbi:MAG: restriction endonuclease, partial [Egibacteraceae bacterium]